MLIKLRLAFKLQMFMHFNITITICTYTDILIMHFFVYRHNSHSIVIQANEDQFQLPSLTHGS
jgi:purine-cytosine permease-like protein